VGSIGNPTPSHPNAHKYNLKVFFIVHTMWGFSSLPGGGHLLLLLLPQNIGQHAFFRGKGEKTKMK